MGAPALAELREIFLGQNGGALELVAGKHYPCDTANAEPRKDGSLAYKITRISLVTLIVAVVPALLTTPSAALGDLASWASVAARPTRGDDVLEDHGGSMLCSRAGHSAPG